MGEGDSQALTDQLMQRPEAQRTQAEVAHQVTAQPPLEADAIGPEDTGPMQIGVVATPPIGSELELAYGDLWARGFPTPEGFVVMAGSEVRSAVNPSAPQIVETRRDELIAAQALIAIPGLSDRQRLCVAVRFASAAIAAKVVTGAHVDSSKWQPPRDPRPILIAA